MIKFKAIIDGKNGMQIEHTNPKLLLETLAVLQYDVPSVEKLLTHLFVEGTAYCNGDYHVMVVVV